MSRRRYRVTGDEPFLAGHFPGNPVFPGVLQLEALAQAGAIAVLSDERYAGKLPLFGGVEDARFRRIVRPGDELVLDVDDGAAERARRLGERRRDASTARSAAAPACLFALAPDAPSLSASAAALLLLARAGAAARGPASCTAAGGRRDDAGGIVGSSGSCRGAASSRRHGRAASRPAPAARVRTR